MERKNEIALEAFARNMRALARRAGNDEPTNPVEHAGQRRAAA